MSTVMLITANVLMFRYLKYSSLATKGCYSALTDDEVWCYLFISHDLQCAIINFVCFGTEGDYFSLHCNAGCSLSLVSLCSAYCGSITFLCDTISMEEELLHSPRLDRSRYSSAWSVFQLTRNVAFLAIWTLAYYFKHLRWLHKQRQWSNRGGYLAKESYKRVFHSCILCHVGYVQYIYGYIRIKHACARAGGGTQFPCMHTVHLIAVLQSACSISEQLLNCSQLALSCCQHQRRTFSSLRQWSKDWTKKCCIVYIHCMW